MTDAPQGLTYSERELWFHCEEARDALARLARVRHDERRLRRALQTIRIYLAIKDGDTHEQIGQPCGVDACIVCLAESTANEALDPTATQQRAA